MIFYNVLSTIEYIFLISVAARGIPISSSPSWWNCGCKRRNSSTHLIFVVTRSRTNFFCIRKIVPIRLKDANTVSSFDFWDILLVATLIATFIATIWRNLPSWVGFLSTSVDIFITRNLIVTNTLCFKFSTSSSGTISLGMSFKPFKRTFTRASSL